MQPCVPWAFFASLTAAAARSYFCNPASAPPEGPGAECYGVIFSFRPRSPT
jgi:hypothetical protein